MEIHAEVLDVVVALGQASLNQILIRANLNRKHARRVMAILTDKGFISTAESEGTLLYSCTQKGRGTLELYRKLGEEYKRASLLI